MEDITGLIMGIGLAIVISIVLMRWQKRKRSQAWQGVVTDIRQVQEPYENSKGDYIIIRYRTDTGEKGRMNLEEYLFQQMYASLKIGDRLIKEPGQDYPRMEAAAGHADASSSSGRTRFGGAGKLSLFLGLLLLAAGVVMSTVQIAGQNVQAEVTGYRLDTHSDPMDSNYIVSYRFQVNDEVFTGTTSRNHAHNISHLPAQGSRISVRYLPGYPGVNAEAGTPLAGMLFMGLGILLIAGRLRPSRRKGWIHQP